MIINEMREMKCFNCGYENNDNLNFCGNCGINLRYVCNNCGFNNNPYQNFCGKCGKPINNQHKIQFNTMHNNELNNNQNINYQKQSTYQQNVSNNSRPIQEINGLLILLTIITMIVGIIFNYSTGYSSGSYFSDILFALVMFLPASIYLIWLTRILVNIDNPTFKMI